MYLPKNQYETGFYSNGSLAYASNSAVYYGPYFTTFDGKYFSGKEPNDGPNDLLILTPSSVIPNQNYEIIAEDPRLYPGNYAYTTLSNQDLQTPLYSPFSYSPILTSDDINNGQFQRYFVKKSNENIYYEVSSINYVQSLAEVLYLSLQLTWYIKGDKHTIRHANARSIDYTEKLNQIKGLGAFLRFDYLQFYQG
jgi:hypothetical protein